MKAVKDIDSNDIDCYRGTSNGCTIYLKDGSEVHTKLSFSEVDQLIEEKLKNK